MLRLGDRVVTPADETAFVELVRGDGTVLCRYAGALNKSNAEVVLQTKLLARWENEKPRPAPVRVGWK